LSPTHNQLPLFVDLDGTLIKSDLSVESLLCLLKRNPLYMLVLPLWLLKGLAHLKQKIAERVDLDTSRLAVNEEFMAYLRQQKERGRSLTLISASNQKYVDAVAAQSGLFTRSIGSSDSDNLKGRHKLARIEELTGKQAFAYAGNSAADIPLWQAATEVIKVNCSADLFRANGSSQSELQFDSPAPWLPQLWRAMRPHQWLKNGLIFVPLILAHRINELPLAFAALLAFFSFSLCASSVYLLNDLLDLDSDRRHASKCSRPLAAGTLPLVTALLAAPLLLLLAFAVAALLPIAFLQALFAYWLLTLLYSVYLKSVFLLDVVTLGLLYTQRLIAGAAAVSVIASPWLLAFSFCMFLGLALVKRVTEVQDASGEDSVPGRAYKPSQRSLLTITGVSANFVAVLVFAFYIYAPETTALYSSPTILWGVCVLLLILLIRLWHHAIGGRLHHDPILFAVSDLPSQVLTGLMFVVLWLAI
jgi:4-hydroxybenzoate polyprenyltransferase/phosphoserine phosphatase